MGNALGKEVFVLCLPEIHSDGIFDRSWHTYPVFEILEMNPYASSMQEFWNVLENWIAEERESGKKECQSEGCSGFSF